MADEQDDASKTEEPTHKRLEDARKKGQIASSREINSFFILTVFAVILTILMPYMMRDIHRTLLPFVASVHEISVDEGNLMLLLGNMLGDVGSVVALPAILAVMAALAAGFMQSRLNFSLEPIKPKFEKVSPLKGLKRMFSMRSVVEFVKGILKISVVGTVAVLVVLPYKDVLVSLPNEDMYDIMLFIATLVKRMMIAVLMVVFLIAAADYTYQRFDFMKNLRMTKQELKDEYKQQEGDPQIKQKLRQIRMEKARKRMLAAVPESDVVVTNPTHYAVALKYDPDGSRAPIVSAKGQDKVAERIKAIAKENKVPIMRNPPLARALFDNVEIDDPIPEKHYQTVAEIISYVYRLKGIDLSKRKASLTPPASKKKKPGGSAKKK